MTSIELRTGAWAGDRPIELTFPGGWEAAVLGDFPPTLSDEQLFGAVREPIGAPPLAELARGRSSAAILIDDLTRPTPAGTLLPHLIGELVRSGVPAERIAVVIANGSHAVPSPAQVARKTGDLGGSGVRIIPHNCREDLVDLGRTSDGTPVMVSRTVAEAELVLSVSCLSPHSFAGYSGGSKIVMPGVCGIETIRHMHGQLQGTDRRGGTLESPARNAMSEAAGMVGLAFSVNVVLNDRREIAAVFAGDRDQAFRAGADFMRSRYRVTVPGDVDVLIADAYPFDTTFQVAFYRAFWALGSAPPGATKVALAACTDGVGTHELFAVADPLHRRILRKLARLGGPTKRGRRPASAYFAQRAAMKNLEYHILSPSLDRAAVTKRYPKSEVYRDWGEIRSLLERRHPGPHRKAAIVRCAPLLVLDSPAD